MNNRQRMDNLKKDLEVLGLEDNGRDSFYVKVNLAEEIELVKQLHRQYHQLTGDYFTRTSFIKDAFRVGLRQLALEVKLLEDSSKGEE